MYLCVYPPPLISFTQPLPDNDGPHEDKHDNCPPALAVQTTSNGATPIGDYGEQDCDDF